MHQILLIGLGTLWLLAVVLAVALCRASAGAHRAVQALPRPDRPRRTRLVLR